MLLPDYARDPSAQYSAECLEREAFKARVGFGAVDARFFGHKVPIATGKPFPTCTVNRFIGEARVQVIGAVECLAEMLK